MFFYPIGRSPKFCKPFQFDSMVLWEPVDGQQRQKWSQSDNWFRLIGMYLTFQEDLNSLGAGYLVIVTKRMERKKTEQYGILLRIKLSMLGTQSWN